MKRYKQLSLDEKICIQENVSKNLNYREMTKAINLVFDKNRSLSTIYREINRHGQNRTHYNGLISEVRRQSRRKRINIQRAKYHYIGLLSFIQRELKNKKSP